MSGEDDVCRWRFDAYRAAIAKLPADLREEDSLRDELCLFDDGNVSLYYAPFDHVNEHASVVLMGITPGRYQHWRACVVARNAIARGLPDADVLRLATESASFAGPMRKHLISMLDGIGLGAALGLDTAGSLFAESGTAHLFSTAAVSFTVFVRGKNYTGSTPRLLGHPLLRRVVEQDFASRLARVPNALIIPLGRVATEVVDHLVRQGMVESRRLLRGFPHPSGANGHRIREYGENRAHMANAVRAWFGLAGKPSDPHGNRD